MSADRPAPGRLVVIPVRGLPEVRPGDDLAALVAAHADLRDGDVVVVAQKAVSKAEGALVAPRPGESRADARRRLAREQAVRVVADAPWALIVETVHGLVCANAGIDASNVPGDALALLPADPDDSARRIRTALRERAGADVAVVVADTFGRPWRLGQTDVAIGLAGLGAVRSEIGSRDREGLVLEVSEAAIADEVAAAADLVRRKAEGVPVVVVRGLEVAPDDDASARDLVRPAATDLFARGRGGVADALAAGDRRAALGGPVSAADRCRALRVTAGGHVTVTATDVADTTTFRLRAAGESSVESGVVAGLLVAALVDLGYQARYSVEDARTIVVRAGRPQPSDRGP